MSHHHACHECDLLVDTGGIEEGQVAICPRCHSPVLHKKIDSLKRTTAICVSGLVLFFPAVYLPLMSIHAMGLANSASIFQGVDILYRSELYFVSLLVLLFCIIAPLFKLSLALILVSYSEAKYVQHTWYKKSLLLYQKVDSWEMLEVFMIGILVSVIKLKDMAELTFGPGILCFTGLMLCVISLKVTFDKALIWEKIHAH